MCRKGPALCGATILDMEISNSNFQWPLLHLNIDMKLVWSSLITSGPRLTVLSLLFPPSSPQQHHTCPISRLEVGINESIALILYSTLLLQKGRDRGPLNWCLFDHLISAFILGEAQHSVYRGTSQEVNLSGCIYIHLHLFSLGENIQTPIPTRLHMSS